VCRDRGRMLVVGAVEMSFPWNDMYLKEIQLFMSRAYGPGSYDPDYEKQGIDYPYAYVPPAEVQPYWNLAGQFTLGDRMFQSNTGPSFVAHQYLIAGQSNFMVEVPTNVPWGCDAPPGTTVPVLTPSGEVPGPFPCQSYRTLADEMDAQGVTWKSYAPAFGNPGYIWSAFDAVRQIRFGSDWTTHVDSPETNIFTDISNGTLPQMSWVTPSLPNSDHAIAASNSGPSWVASIVDAIGASPYWNDTAIIITWDDWGGWYDHVTPPQRDIMGDGFRVPLLVVSPYAKHGYVSHATHDFGSILRFAEDTFGLPRLGTNDMAWDSLNDCFDFTQTPRPLQPVRTTVSRRALMLQSRSLLPPDND